MEYINKVTKISDLEENDSISVYDYLWAAQQNHNCFEVFHNFINGVKPKRILEIGAALGGLTSFLKYTVDNSNINCDILSFDIYEHHWYNEIRDMGVDLRVENIFSSDYTSVSPYVIDYIKSNGTTAVFCDGGNKIAEFNLLSNYLKPGDFIFAHDYAIDKEYFDKEIYKKIWNWFEISEADITDACKKNNLIDYNRDVFQSIVWVSKIKI